MGSHKYLINQTTNQNKVVKHHTFIRIPEVQK